MKKNLFVTLADRKYLEYAKQVFAGAYFNAGWQGDYMLLAHDVSEKDVRWFRKKGILVKHCKPIFEQKIANTLPVIISKLYLFTNYFKKWENVVYYDVDVILRSSIRPILKFGNFAAVDDIFHAKLTREIISYRESRRRGLTRKSYEQLIKKLTHRINLNQLMFGAGMFVFNSKIIEKNTFRDLISLIKQYHCISRDADMFTLNIYFYRKWKRLPAIYDMCLYNQKNQWRLPNNKLNGAAIHFCTHKPWVKNNYFHREWLNNYQKADYIDLKDIPKIRSWPESKILFYNVYLWLRERPLKFYKLRDFLIQIYFKIVIFFEDNFPEFFSILKSGKKSFLMYHQSILLFLNQKFFSLKAFKIDLGIVRSMKPVIFGMTSKWEQSYLRWYAQKKYLGKGEIVDLGVWLGATTVALAEGLSRNTRISNRDGRIHSFDDFIWIPSMMNYAIKKTKYENEYHNGDNFHYEFEKNISPYKKYVCVYEGDLIRTKWKGNKIEFLFIDACKSWVLANSIIKNFFPHLIPGMSIRVEQDFGYYKTYWIRLITYRFRQYFKPILQIPFSQSVVFILKKPIPKNLIGEDYSLKSFSNKEIESAFRYSQKLIKGPWEMSTLAAKAICYLELGEFAKAEDIFFTIKNAAKKDKMINEHFSDFIKEYKERRNQ